MNSKIKKISLEILLIVFLQIFLLMNISFADSYIINKQREIKDSIIENKKDTILNTLGNGLNFLIGFFSIKQIGTVSASEVCCEKLAGGGWCLDAESGSCDPAYTTSGTTCSSTSYCKLGWCFDPVNGFCSTGSPKKRCEIQGGEWSLNFNADKCTKGCCVLGINTQYVEKKRCEILSNSYGINMEFNQMLSEAECRFYSDDEGACILSNSECKRTTEKICHDQYSGTFYNGKLCSSPNLNTTCTRQASVKCEEGKDEIYWYDSCGNRENIYDSNKDRSWNNGKILTKAQSCNPNNSNINNRNCGNCGYNFESMCKQTTQSQTHVIDGNYVCSSKNCGSRVNGESWCEYESYVGNLSVKLDKPGRGGGMIGNFEKIFSGGEGSTQIGTDLPGSNHFLKSCNNGEIQTEMCGSTGYREEICAEKKVNGISKAQCRTNFATLCFTQTNQEECQAVPDCIWQSVDLTGQDSRDNFAFSACVPKYPKGFNIFSNDPDENGKNLCGAMGDNGKVTCTRIEQKGTDFAWGCKVNCGCDSKEFVEQMNDFCSSLGDCGVSMNVAGDISGDLPLGGQFKRPTIQEWINRYKGLLSNTTNKIGENIPLFVSFAENPGDYSGTVAGDLGIPEGPGGYGLFFGLAGTGIGVVALLFLSGPIGWIVGGIGIIVSFFGSLFGIGKTREKTTTFTCLPWKPPIGGSKCNLCNQDPEKPCTEYRCQSLGTSCKLETAVYDTENPICINAYSQDNTPPVLTFEKVEPGKFNIAGNKITITKSTTENCYTRYMDTINLTIKTDETAICKWDITDKPIFDELAHYFREENSWSQTHLIEELPIAGNGRLNLYIKCQDHAGNYNTQSMSVEACIKDAPDTLPPRIEKTAPESESYIPMNVNQTQFKIYLNEPSQCLFDYSPNILFENMSNYMSCNVEDYEAFEWSCKALLENITQESVSVYIKCNDSSGNINTEDYPYTLYKTQDPLKITSTIPANNSIIKKSVTANDPFYLEAATSGGVENGKAVCSFKFIENGWRDFFTETNSDHHRYMFTSLPSGNYTVEIFCTDSIGNTASSAISFESQIDTTPPKIVRAFHDGSSLKLITDENALCYYSNVNCNFDINNATKFTDGSLFKKEHSEYWNSDKTYYLKCEDEYNNKNVGCALIIKPSTI
jgi:hypothetical protein